jgi:antitoxin VapB
LFFFEKKNQKTFATWARGCRQLRDQFAKVFCFSLPLTESVRGVLAERFERVKWRRGQGGDLSTVLVEIGRHCAALPDLDTRSAEEVVGYDDGGMWR